MTTSISPDVREAGPGRGEVVLHVAGAALGVDDERIGRALALELAQDLLVRAPDGVDEGVEPSAMCHADHDLVRAARGREGDGLVEHRHERLEALERELLLPEERAAQILLEALRLGEPAEKRAPLLRLERLPEAAGLDRLPEPDALGVIRDVLDLVGHRAGVDVPEERERLEQRLAVDVQAKQRRRESAPAAPA